MAFYRKHSDPVVELILNSEPSPEGVFHKLSTSPHARLPKVQAMLTIMLVEAGVRSGKEANRLAEKVYHEPCHVDLHVLFSALWYGMLMNLEVRPVEQLRALEASMNTHAADSEVPEIKALVRFTQAVTYSLQRNYKKQEELSKGLLDDVPRDSPYYSKLLCMSSIAYLQRGMGIAVEPALKTITPSTFDEVGLGICRFHQ